VAEVAWEWEEPAEVEASHLMSCQCRGCGTGTLATPEHVADALCGPCRGGGAVGVLGAYSPVVGYPRSSQRREELGAKLEHPAPELPGHWCESREHAIPKVVEKLVVAAKGGGWEVRVSHSRGTGMHGTTGKPTSIREIWQLGFGRHPERGEQACAAYSVPGGWGSMWIWGKRRTFWSVPTLADLGEWLAGVGVDWYAGVEQRVAEVAEAKEEHAAAVKLVRELGMAEAVRSFGLELEIPELYELFKIKERKTKEGAR